MAKRKSAPTSSSQRRDNLSIARSLTYFRNQPLLPFDSLPFTELTTVEDRRTFHPRGEVREARSFRTPHHQLVYRPAAPVIMGHPNRIPQSVAFHAPREVLVCVRRKTRKEVLHAFNKTGKSGQKRPRRNHYSSISCKG